MGTVYRVRHLNLAKCFALKIISPTFSANGQARELFNAEAQIASEIAHPNIVSVVDFGEDSQFGAYMVMELVEGEPLVAPGVLPMSVKRAIDVLGQVADALDHIHKRGIVHGDVKAENIMLTAEQTSGSGGARRRRVVRLLDFGLARRPGGEDEEEISGSPHYLAPERAAGGPPSVAADIYALGVLGYLMLSGTLPFDGNVVEILMAHINQPPESPAKRRGEQIDESLETLIMRAMSKDPAHRHGSAAAFRYELNTVMDMLEMGRRRRASGTGQPESPRDSTLVAAFERSRVPQALVSIDGRIEFSNKAFSRLLGHDDSVDGLGLTETPLNAFVPGLMRALRAAHVDGKPCERRARVFRGDDKPALELTLWFCPLPIAGTEIHLMIRVEEEDPKRRARDNSNPSY
jgi:serine/threonine protein kinase